jgi:hypothetical protein
MGSTAVPATAADPNWTLVRRDGECRLESAVATISDGYIETPVRLELRDDAFFVVTESNLDLGDPGLGLRIDRDPVVPVAEPVGKTGARLAGDPDELVPRMIRGQQAELLLKFWPTWPETGVKTAPFSLIGFTKVYRQLEDCAAEPTEVKE